VVDTEMRTLGMGAGRSDLALYVMVSRLSVPSAGEGPQAGRCATVEGWRKAPRAG